MTDIKENIEEVTYSRYLTRLFEICYECNHENYLAEIFIPLFRECCCENTKIVPVFDDRKTGPKTENKTDAIKRMETIYGSKEDEEYTVPDYLFVSKDYSFFNPQKPIIIVETKKPILIYKNNKTYYREFSVTDYESQLLKDIRNCTPVIFTDGITWMFLKEDEMGHLVDENRFEPIRLVQLGNKYYECKEIINAPDKISEWNELKERIRQLLIEKTKK